MAFRSSEMGIRGLFVLWHEAKCLNVYSTIQKLNLTLPNSGFIPHSASALANILMVVRSVHFRFSVVIFCKGPSGRYLEC